MHVQDMEDLVVIRRSWTGGLEASKAVLSAVF